MVDDHRKDLESIGRSQADSRARLAEAQRVLGGHNLLGAPNFQGQLN